MTKRFGLVLMVLALLISFAGSAMAANFTVDYTLTDKQDSETSGQVFFTGTTLTDGSPITVNGNLIKELTFTGVERDISSAIVNYGVGGATLTTLSADQSGVEFSVNVSTLETSGRKAVKIQVQTEDAVAASTVPQDVTDAAVAAVVPYALAAAQDIYDAASDAFASPADIEQAALDAYTAALNGTPATNPADARSDIANAVLSPKTFATAVWSDINTFAASGSANDAAAVAAVLVAATGTDDVTAALKDAVLADGSITGFSGNESTAKTAVLTLLGSTGDGQSAGFVKNVYDAADAIDSAATGANIDVYDAAVAVANAAASGTTADDRAESAETEAANHTTPTAVKAAADAVAKAARDKADGAAATLGYLEFEINYTAPSAELVTTATLGAFPSDADGFAGTAFDNSPGKLLVPDAAYLRSDVFKPILETFFHSTEYASDRLLSGAYSLPVVTNTAKLTNEGGIALLSYAVAGAGAQALREAFTDLNGTNKYDVINFYKLTGNFNTGANVFKLDQHGSSGAWKNGEWAILSQTVLNDNILDDPAILAAAIESGSLGALVSKPDPAKGASLALDKLTAITADDDYVLIFAIEDDGAYDLDDRAGWVVDPVVLAGYKSRSGYDGTHNPVSSGGGCDAGFGAFALILAGGAAMVLRRKK